MALIRSILHLMVMTITIMIWAFVMVIGRFFLKEHQLYKIGEKWCQLVICSLRSICGVKWKITGIENLPKDPDARVVVLCKHQSAWETLAMNWMLKREMVFVFKKELLRIPFFGWAIGSVDMIYIDRKARSKAIQKIIEQGQRFIDKGRWIIMFPEGTRVPRGETIPYKSGGSRVAIASKAIVIPIAVSSAKCWPKGSFIKKPGTIDVVIGEPIPSEGKDHNQLAREVQDWIEQQMRIIDPSAYKTENAKMLNVIDKE